MKTSAGCAQPVHSVLRRWVGGASFIWPSSRAKHTPLLSPNDGSNTTSSIRITHITSTRRSIPTTQSTGALTPSSPPLIPCNTYPRHLSGIGKVTSPEERSAATGVRLESKRRDGHGSVGVGVVPPVDGPPTIGLDDLQDLNAEIAGFVGSLGDPDFDVQDNGPTTSPATDRRHDHHQHYHDTG